MAAVSTRPAAVPGPRLAVLTLLAAGVGAFAGVQLVDANGTPYAWDLDTPQPNVVNGEVTYYVDPTGTRDVVTGPISDVTAVRRGVEAWELGTSRIRFTEDPARSATGRDGTDRVNYIGWTTTGLGRLTLAVTFPTRSGSRILDMDVIFNDAFDWDTRTPGSRGIADVQAIMTHEWGHALGADHVPLQASTMYFSSAEGSIAYRTLAADDRALVGALYPNDAFRQTTGTIRGSVTHSGPGDSRAIHVVAVSVVTNEPAASTLTRPDGSFEIAGLPRGAYRLVAAPTVPLSGAMNSYWTSGSTSFLPAVATTRPGNPAPARSVAVTPETITVVPAFSVADVSAPFEPNESRAQAASIALGDGVTARLESGGDVDWYGFDATAGQRVTIAVLGWHLGSRIDPALSLTDALGVPLATSEDTRSDAFFGTREEGPDLDARLVAVEIPSTGRYFVQVRNQTTTSTTASFYALLVTPASDAPSAALTTVVADPPRLDADGRGQTTITITPVRETGDPVGAGATVELSHDGAGAFGDVVDEGDGTYTVTATAPREPGKDRVTLTISNAVGTAVVPDAVVLVYLGPMDARTSETSVLPRRVAADGAATSAVTFLPRDAHGEALGKGRAPAFGTSGAAGAAVGPATDLGDGRYTTTLTAGRSEGAAEISVTLDAQAIGPIGTVHLGFPLRDVAAQADADAAWFLLDEGLPRKAVSALRAMTKQTAKVPAALDDDNAKKAVAATRKALGKLVKARKKAKGALPAPGTDDELAQAVRQAAQEQVDHAVVAGGRDQRKLDKAELLLLDGDQFLLAGDARKAAARYEKAFRLAARLGP